MEVAAAERAGQLVGEVERRLAEDRLVVVGARVCSVSHNVPGPAGDRVRVGTARPLMQVFLMDLVRLCS